MTWARQAGNAREEWMSESEGHISFTRIFRMVVNVLVAFVVVAIMLKVLKYVIALVLTALGLFLPT